MDARILDLIATVIECCESTPEPAPGHPPTQTVRVMATLRRFLREGTPSRSLRASGDEASRYGGQRRCDARPLLGEPLDAAVWTEVCQLPQDPARVAAEYQRRPGALRTGPRRPEMETVERQLAKMRAGVGRLVDS